MDHIASSPRADGNSFDLECGKDAIEELGSTNLAASNTEGFVRGATITDESATAKSGFGVGYMEENVKLLIDSNLEREMTSDLAEKERKERRKSTSAKKPPRPPRGLSLDAADQKLIKELAEIAIMKRARIERMKELKRMKAAKATSPLNGPCLAMLLTILFCVVVIFQGMSWPNASPKSAKATENSLISVQNRWNSSFTTQSHGPSSYAVVKRTAATGSKAS